MRVKDVFDPRWLLNPAKVFPLAASATRRRGGVSGAVGGGSAPRLRLPRDVWSQRRRQCARRRGGAGRGDPGGARAAAPSAAAFTRGRGGGGGAAVARAALSGIVLYEPGALTLVARAGTPVAEVEAALAAEGQRLAFEPPDLRALLGTTRRADAGRGGGGERLGPAAGAGGGGAGRAARAAVRGRDRDGGRRTAGG